MGDEEIDAKAWEKIKEEMKLAHPLARIRRLHAIIQNTRIIQKIREEAKELATKARVELDSEQFWKWGGAALIPSGGSAPALEESVAEERPKRSLEDTVETAAPEQKPGAMMPETAYSGKAGEEYLSKGYFSKTGYKSAMEQEASRRDVAEATATASEIAAGEAKYSRSHKHTEY